MKIKLKFEEKRSLDQEEFPAVTIIIPVRNNETKLKVCLHAISGQEYPSGKIEILVVDNNSSCPPSEVVEKYGNAKLLFYRSTNSPYPSRNLGIRNAKNEIIILLDSNCIPSPRWLITGIRALQATHASAVAGDIRFYYSKQINSGHFADTLLFANVEAAIMNGGAPGGNIFTKKETFRQFGYFPETIRSNGDSIWSNNITRNGGLIIYEKNAYVEYAARGTWQFFRKSYRIGKGSYYYWKFLGYSNYKMISLSLRQINQFSHTDIKKAIKIRFPEHTRPPLVKIHLVIQIGFILRAIARTQTMFVQKLFRNINNSIHSQNF
ncbi:Glycosyl transferase family 2 [Chitinophaga jiangningensis]|uniref:Glycosyl transferase family 2 n=1 Tax=Chitinophaga jiangningensis TaxID=1419482 RepID=A0A1M7IS73_9BACT|nr:glycosyltransferase [Chitinophaga jiangningensis]SHM43561.1 Glycosyl transferase family 2 [Chitinophaga jiangningensis]